ncbi:DUF421 domain-containing protein [Herpetosiphon geysericola]|uniref:Membrane protein n=1 Tax=Herpetosiphon geysericola TaxID=70996 RepID=A0A0P6XHK1_9CHLR|nr:YetF domain-containing protein [Herpetosiphon geysericola]KPL79583.1 membrane protein [Herpetosiphon geysericola]
MHVIFDGWAGIGRTIVAGILGYLALVVFLRVSGKRTLSKMNAFDLVVTVALGSTLATIVLSHDVSLAEGTAAYAVLIAMQFVIAWLSVRFPAISRLVKSEPQLLVYQGRLLEDAMHRERVVEAEVLSALRQQGIASLAAGTAVVLETDGSFTVISDPDLRPPSVLRDVAGADQAVPAVSKEA